MRKFANVPAGYVLVALLAVFLTGWWALTPSYDHTLIVVDDNGQHTSPHLTRRECSQMYFAVNPWGAQRACIDANGQSDLDPDIAHAHGATVASDMPQ